MAGYSSPPPSHAWGVVVDPNDCLGDGGRRRLYVGLCLPCPELNGAAGVEAALMMPLGGGRRLLVVGWAEPGPAPDGNRNLSLLGYGKVWISSGTRTPCT